jgi:hypothetical protein
MHARWLWKGGALFFVLLGGVYVTTIGQFCDKPVTMYVFTSEALR